MRAARLSEWRERALLAAEAALEERERDGRDDEIARLKGKVGEVSSCSPSSMRATQPTIMLAGSHVGMLYGWHAW